MAAHLISVDPVETKLVTIHELAVAREYYRHVEKNPVISNQISSLLLSGIGYTRYVDDADLLVNIRDVDRATVMRL